MPARRRASEGRVGLRAFGREVGASLAAVQKGVRSGRLRESVRRDAKGKPSLDLALARREWVDGATRPANNGGGNGKGHAGPASDGAPGSLVAAQLRVAAGRAAALELSNARKRGEVLDAVSVQHDYFEAARAIRERMLNIPDRMGDLEPAQRARLRAEIRQALGDLADELERA